MKNEPTRGAHRERIAWLERPVPLTPNGRGRIVGVSETAPMGAALFKRLQREAAVHGEQEPAAGSRTLAHMGGRVRSRRWSARPAPSWISLPQSRDESEVTACLARN